MEGDGTVPLDTVLLDLEELGEKVPAALQCLKEKVRLLQARMKELRLTEGEVVRAAQRISASLSGGTGQNSQGGLESPLPCLTAKQSQPVVQLPKLTLSRNHTLHDKKQLTLVAMMQRPAPAPSTTASPGKENSSPPHQTFSLDKAHLLAFWRCSLPLGRMKEVLNIVEAVFVQREAQAAKAAKAALALASRRRPSPRTMPDSRHTTPNRRRTRAMRCTTTITQWQGWSATHTPVTPCSTVSSPTTPQSSSGHTSTPHSPSHHPSTPNGASHNCTPQSSAQPTVPLSESCQHRTPQTNPQYRSTPSTGSPLPTTPSDFWHHSSPCNNSYQSETLCSKSHQVGAQKLNVSPKKSPPLIKMESESSQPHQPATTCSTKAQSNRQSQSPASAKNVAKELSPPTTSVSSHEAATEVCTMVTAGQLVSQATPLS